MPAGMNGSDELFVSSIDGAVETELGLFCSSDVDCSAPEASWLCDDIDELIPSGSELQLTVASLPGPAAAAAKATAAFCCSRGTSIDCHWPHLCAGKRESIILTLHS